MSRWLFWAYFGRLVGVGWALALGARGSIKHLKFAQKFKPILLKDGIREIYLKIKEGV